MFGRKPTTTETARPGLPEAPEKLNEALPELETLWAPTAAPVRQSVEALLLERKQITEEQLVQAKQVASQTPGKSIAQVLLTMNAASEAQILSALAETLGLAFEQPSREEIETAAFEMLSPDYIRRQFVLPLRLEGERLVVAVVDPNNVFLLDEVRRKTRKDLKTVVTTAADINRIGEQLTASAVDTKVDDIIKDVAEDDVQVMKEDQDDVTDLAKAGSESPIIRFVNYLIFDAIKQGASENALTIWKKQIDQPHGILLVTGPTGSGKTTTLYASLRCMDAGKLNISTVEDLSLIHISE